MPWSYVEACKSVSAESGWPLECCRRCGTRCLAKHGVRLCPTCRTAEQKVTDRAARLPHCGSQECACGGRDENIPADSSDAPSGVQATGPAQLNLLDAA